VGVQSAAGSACGVDDADRCLVFAINGWHQWSNASGNEFDIAIDTTGDGNPDYFVVGVDLGAVLTGSFDGVMASFTFDTAGNVVDAFYADAPMNSSTLELPAIASHMGITADSPAFTYSVVGFDLITGKVDSVPGAASYDPFNPSVSSGQFVSVNPGGSTFLPVAVDVAAQKTTPALGWMIVSLDNASGSSQAALIPVGHLPNH
jgi:minor extracellular serine protease Vpr